MTPKKFLFTSESVTEGHPDKVCDQISDAILDEFLTKDRQSRVAAETTVTTGMALVCGEITADCYVDIPQVVRNTIKNIGYTGCNAGGFDADTCAVLTSIDEQSTDIGNGVNKAFETRENNAATSTSETEELGAGDQGIMFGYACNETPELMPLPISLAHKLSYRLSQVRKLGLVDYLRPDGKSQVTVEYIDGKPARIHTVLLSTQHNPTINGISDNQKVQEIIKKNKYIHSKFSDEDIKGLINAVLEEETRLRKNFNPKSEGCFSPAVAGVLYKTPDGKSEYFFGINSNSTAYPGNINSTLLKRIIYMPDNIENSYKNSTGKGSHAEIFAICDAMDKYKNADKDDFLIYVNASKYTRETTFDPFCTCPHCEYILKDFNIISNTERIEY